MGGQKEAMREKISGLHPVLKELILGILIFGGIFEVTLIWFSSDKVLFSSGLWLGAALAVLMVCHMYHVLDNALGMPENAAGSHIRRGHALRFFLTVAAFLGVYFLKIGNPVAFFLGVLTLKFSAYLQPWMHEILTKKKKGG